MLQLPMEVPEYITFISGDFDSSSFSDCFLQKKSFSDCSPEHIAAILEDYDSSSSSDCSPEHITFIPEDFDDSSSPSYHSHEYISVVPADFDDSSSLSDCSPEHIAAILEDFDNSSPSDRSPECIPAVPADFNDSSSPSDCSPEHIAAILEDFGISVPPDCSPEHIAAILEDIESSSPSDCSPPSYVASSRTSSNIEAQPRPSLSSRESSLKSSKHGSNFLPIASTYRTALSRDSFAPGQRVLWGNIKCDGYKPAKDIGLKSFSKGRVLNPINSHYGYGSVINTRKQEVKETVQSRDDVLNKDLYKEAPQKYDKVRNTRLNNVNWRIFRADAMVQSGRLEDAFREYCVANTLDPTNGELHHKMSLFHLRLGLPDKAEQHVSQATPECKADLNAKIKEMRGHLVRGGNARKYGNWLAALQEVDAIFAEGTDSSKPILAFRAEMLLRLDHLDQAEETISKAFTLESNLPSSDKFLGMSPHAYVCVVHAQIEMALGRFESATKAADTAHKINPSNGEISAILTTARMTRVACIKGNKFYSEAKYLKAYNEYKVGLKYSKSNISLLSNITVCYLQMERWESCIQICNQILSIQPKNTKALLRRASSYAKLEKWAECVSDYETAATFFPEDAKLVEALLDAQVALKESQVKDVSRMLLGPELEEVMLNGVALKESQVEDALHMLPGPELKQVMFNAPVALKESQFEDVSHMVDGTKLGEVMLDAPVVLNESQVKDVSGMLARPELEEVTAAEQLQEYDCIPGNSIVFFYHPTDHLCAELSPYVDALSIFYPSVNFIKVDIRECSTTADDEIMHLVPLFVMYRKGCKKTEMVRPTNDVELGSWVDYIASQIERQEQD